MFVLMLMDQSKFLTLTRGDAMPLWIYAGLLVCAVLFCEGEDEDVQIDTSPRTHFFFTFVFEGKKSPVFKCQ